MRFVDDMAFIDDMAVYDIAVDDMAANYIAVNEKYLPQRKLTNFGCDTFNDYFLFQI